MSGPTHLPLAAACGAGFLWGTGALVVDVLIRQHGLAPENISFWRFAVGAALLMMLFMRAPLWPRVRAQALALGGAGACMAGYVLCWFLGIERIGAAVPTLIALCLPPVLVTLVALLRRREWPGLSLLAVLAAALAGTALIVLPHAGPAASGHQPLLAGVLFSVASAVLYAVFTLASGRLSQALGAGASAAWLTLVAAGVMGVAALWRPLRWPAEVPPQAWFLYLGVVTAALALLAFSWGAARLSPTALTVATLVEPLTAVLLAALLLGQPLQAGQWLGAALLLGALWGLGRRVVPHG